MRRTGECMEAVLHRYQAMKSTRGAVIELCHFQVRKGSSSRAGMCADFMRSRAQRATSHERLSGTFVGPAMSLVRARGGVRPLVWVGGRVFARWWVCGRAEGNSCRSWLCFAAAGGWVRLLWRGSAWGVRHSLRDLLESTQGAPTARLLLRRLLLYL